MIPPVLHRHRERPRLELPRRLHYERGPGVQWSLRARVVAVALAAGAVWFLAALVLR